MKKSIVNKMIAGAIASTMILGMVACGSGETQPSDGASGSVPSDTGSDASGSAAGGSATPEPSPEPLKITVEVGGGTSLDQESEWYKRLVADINEYTNMDVTYKWQDSEALKDSLVLKYISHDVADVTLASADAAFYEACKAGMFWELTDYIDEYDNLAVIPATAWDNASRNGEIWAIPSYRTLARNGFGYRVDWLNNLGLKEPTDWESFKNMLYAFTYNDPDGNGVDDTVGLGVDQWTGMWDIMKVWFGVPHVWGLDQNGDLVHESQTKEYKEAWAAFRELYSLGVINSGTNGITSWEELSPGAARKSLLQTGQAGCLVQTLGDCRKVQQSFENNGITTTDNIIFTLGNVIECGYGPKVQTNGGTGNQVAISTKNIKTEEQLRQVLSYLNDLNDGVMLNLMDYGWEGITYELDTDGYIVRYDAEQLAANGVVGNYNDGFNQLYANFTAEANARPYTVRTDYTPIVQMEKDFNASGEKSLVYNIGKSYISATYLSQGSALDALLEQAEMDYLTGVIDEAGFDAAITQWWTAGGEQITKEMNELYRAAGK